MSEPPIGSFSHTRRHGSMLIVSPNILGHIILRHMWPTGHRFDIPSLDSPKRHRYQDLMSLYYLSHLWPNEVGVTCVSHVTCDHWAGTRALLPKSLRDSVLHCSSYRNTSACGFRVANLLAAIMPYCGSGMWDRQESQALQTFAVLVGNHWDGFVYVSFWELHLHGSFSLSPNSSETLTRPPWTSKTWWMPR